MLGYFLLFCSSALLTVLVLIPLLWLFRVLNLSQNIREDGPTKHLKKKGTLTFGGIAFVLVILAFSVVFLDLDINIEICALIILMLSFAVIGFLDDFLKKIKGKNEGLYGRYKFLLQCVFAFLFSLYLLSSTNFHVTLSPIIYVPFAIFVIAGSSNAANLTDGLDGLLAGVAAIAFLSLAGIAVKLNQPEIAALGVISAGAMAGFLVFNIHPAKVFMGDVGSLPIGALISGIAILLHKEWWLLLVAGVLVIETLSVLIQIASYKLFKRRVFKMSPLHHHFELIGFSEVQVVLMFWGTAAALGLLAYLLV
ncbi:MAG: phospho-N-acetylmuramoyl-pentapeptide-transferase [Candidatus Margulisbacteria bacterium]|nr:phospho-N-acetylmuramoyl-pentapeptide-transferase [Candidatus Margulisiibacteriota bacterium]MBU1022573.1 phospho-N-acetylmuramoyl-pentapeptide-transferase [Candidatus Margulisiibacteriota bacterium]MBU1728859.1 phospho-N-acetylmuramoyl-pentapeptide-transferase [Candidatus Margulisiibacteriota bacterium]MBU1955490.1 phospho-N-acetylmuramoyl-pentapeptide-transferase [Candidatus Margulisiibacteriota bacterium]